jgi:hypothetical protein
MKKVTNIIFFAGLALAFFACKNPKSLYEEYIVPNGLSYPAKALRPEARPGNERIEIAWRNGYDPKVEKARIFWSNYKDSLEVEVNENMRIITKMIDPLAENTYTFVIRTYDGDGNVSIPVELTAKVYGEIYRSALSNRILKSSAFDGANLTINWNEADETETGVNLNYTDTNGAKTHIVPPSETRTILAGFDIKKPLKYSTMYLPDSLAIDIFHATEIETMIVP